MPAVITKVPLVFPLFNVHIAFALQPINMKVTIISKGVRGQT